MINIAIDNQYHSLPNSIHSWMQDASFSHFVPFFQFYVSFIQTGSVLLLISSFHQVFGLPTLLRPFLTRHSNTCLGHLLSVIRATCPAHFYLRLFFWWYLEVWFASLSKCFFLFASLIPNVILSWALGLLAIFYASFSARHHSTTSYASNENIFTVLDMSDVKVCFSYLKDPDDSRILLVISSLMLFFLVVIFWPK